MARKKNAPSRSRSPRRRQSMKVPRGSTGADLRREMRQTTFYAVCRILEAGEDDPVRLEQLHQQKSALEKKLGYEPDREDSVPIPMTESERRKLRRSLHQGGGTYAGALRRAAGARAEQHE